MMPTLRKCQERAKDAIRDDIVSYLEDYSTDTKERRYGFMAPTGSGKTLVMAWTIKEVARERNKKVAFIWLTLGKGELADQSREKLAIYLNQSGLKLLSIQDAILQDDLTGCVVVAGWDSLNKIDKEGNIISIVMRDNEKMNFPKVCEQTRANGTPIVLLIDESHAFAFTDKSLEIRNKHIQPTYTLEVSATPKYGNWASYTKITYEEAAKAGLIKKSIRQATFLAWQDGIRAGAKKLQELLALAKDTSAQYNPRMLVFLPNANQDGGTELDQVTAMLEAEFSWTEDSGDVTVWMSKYKSENYESCKENDSLSKVILTKEAIDTGIDIPAVQVIVHLRPQGSTQVEVQKLGRGLRMPELKHYGNDLDRLYFFVFNDHDLDFKGADFLKDILSTKASAIKPQFLSSCERFPALKCSYYERKHPLLELDGEEFSETFTPLFSEKLKSYTQFNWDESYSEETREGSLDLDTKTATYDTYTQSPLDEDSTDNFYFDRMKTKLKRAFRHMGIIEDCIGSFVQEMQPDSTVTDWQTFTLNNFSELDRLIFESVNKGEAELDLAKIKREFDFHFQQECFIDSEADTHYQKFLHDKYFVARGGRSAIETAFEQYVDTSKNVLWWMKNYDRQYAQSFSVCYGDEKVFFPDYIIALNDGTYLIVDTKSGNMDIAEKAKREALVAACAGVISIRAGIIKQERDHFYLHSETSKPPVALNGII